MARQHAPSTSLPLGFMIFGLVCLGVAAVWLALSPDRILKDPYTAHTVAWTHLFILGFVLSIVMGALYQIAPVALEVKLYSERLAKIHFFFHTIGVSFMVAMFCIGNFKQVGHAGTVVFFGMLLFVYNIARTLGRIPTPDIVAAFVICGMLWLFLTMSAGLIITADKFWPILPQRGGNWIYAHAHLGIGGVFINLIAGVSLRLVPMFGLSEIQNLTRARCAFLLINVSIAWLFSAIAMSTGYFAIACGVILAIGLMIYLVEIFAILSARRRRRLDWGMRMFVSALILLIPTIITGFFVSWPEADYDAILPRLRNLYALLALFGVVGFAVIGMLHKILPFLIWYRVYSPQIGKTYVPILADMLSQRLQVITFVTYLFSMAMIISALLLNARYIAAMGIWIWAVSVFIFLTNIGLVFRHLLKTRSPQFETPSLAISS